MLHIERNDSGKEKQIYQKSLSTLKIWSDKSITGIHLYSQNSLKLFPQPKLSSHPHFCDQLSLILSRNTHVSRQSQLFHLPWITHAQSDVLIQNHLIY